MQKGKGVSANAKQNIKKALRFFLSIVIFLSIGFFLLNYVPFISKYDSYVVVTPSMVPVINVNDVVVVDDSIAVEDIQIGQIIAFYADINDDGTDEVIVHYLNSVVEDGDNTYYTTISEAGGQDPWQLSADDILGVHVLTIPKIGRFLQFTQSTIGRVVLIADVLIVYIVMELLADDKNSKKDKEKKIKKVEESD